MATSTSQIGNQVLDYLDGLYNLSTALPYRWKWENLLDIEYRDRLWIDHIFQDLEDVPEPEQDQVVQKFTRAQPKFIVRVNLLDNVLAILEQELWNDSMIVSHYNQSFMFLDEIKQQIDELYQTHAEMLSTPKMRHYYYELMTKLDHYRTDISDTKQRNSVIRHEFQTKRRSELRKAYLDKVKPEVEERFSLVSTDVFALVELRSTLEINNYRAESSFIKELSVEALHQSLFAVLASTESVSYLRSAISQLFLRQLKFNLTYLF